MDSTLAAGIVGGVCAIAGSVVSHVLLFTFERWKVRADKRAVALEHVLVFCEKCKIGEARRLSDDDYYRLITVLASLEKDLRRKVIDIYQDSIHESVDASVVHARASALQETIAEEIAKGVRA